LRTEPTHLGVVGQATVGAAHVRSHLRDVHPDQPRGDLLCGQGHHVVAAADGEGETVPGQRRALTVISGDRTGVAARAGPQRDVDGGVVAVLVHRIRTVLGHRGRKADVGYVHIGDLHTSSIA